MTKVQNILENQYLKIDFYTEIGAIEVSAKSKSIELDDDDLKNVILKIIEVLKDIKPKFYIANNKDFETVYSVDIQDWVVNIFVTTFIEIGIKKTAQIKPQEFISSLSFEQVVDQANEVYQLPFQTEYFDEVEKALKWFLS